MEDENGLELSLGLSCGGSSAKSKAKNGSSLDNRIDEGDKSNKLMDDFKTFLHAGIHKQESGAGSGSHRSDAVKPQENFFNNLSKTAVDADAPVNFNGGGLWVANSRSADLEEEKRSETGNKRKMYFDEINHQRKLERDAHNADVHDKAKTSHVSVTTEDGSTAENEDVAESEVEGSTSGMVSHHEESAKQYTMGGGSSEVPSSKEIHGFTDSNAVELQGQKRFNIPSENEFKLGNMNYGVPYAVQPMNIMNFPYSLPMKESNIVGAPVTSGYTLPGMMQMMPPSNSERPGAHPVNSGNMPMTFGYPPVQLPMLDKDHSCGFVSNPQQLHPSYAGRGTSSVAPNSEKHNEGLKMSQVAYDGRATEQAKGDNKQHVAEEGSSSQTDDDVKGNNRPTTTEVPIHEGSAIRPGIAADLKIGGSGSYPNLPWVSTTAPGPNGKTISGVTYRYNSNQIRIVCACHSSHMSPEEFVRHAGEDNANAETGNGNGNGNGMPSFPNPAASAQS